MFGYVYSGTIKNLGIENADIVRNLTSNMAYAGIFAAVISNSTISNCWSTGTIIAYASGLSRDCNVGGIVGEMYNSTISNCFSMAAASGSSPNGYACSGGIVGEIGLNSFSLVLNCYSAGTISAIGNRSVGVGGVAGYIYATELSNCAALNPEITCNASATNWRAFGRVVGRNSGALANNTGFESMINPSGGTTWNNVGATNPDGISISKSQIHLDGTLGGRFTAENGWKTRNGKLPGLREVVQMPEHLRIQGLPYFETTAIPNGEVGAEYYQTLAAAGNNPITWSFESGNLPPGLIFSTEDATIHGIPTTAGTYNFTIMITNSLGSDFWEYSLTIFRNLYITTTTLANAMSGAEYNQTLSATSNSPVTWTIETGNLPQGLTLSEDGQIEGTPTVSGTFVFTVKAETLWEIDTKEFSLTTKYLFITTGNLPAGEVGVNYATTLTADGIQPIFWELETGTLPSGLNLSANGVISGLPTTSGQYKFTLKATNDLDFDVKSFSITIIRNLYITTPTLPDGEANTYYSQTLTATSNTPLNWTIISGNLPTGLTLSQGGQIAGTPSVFGTFVFTVKAESLYEIYTKEFTLLIINNPKITTANLPIGFKNYSYNTTLDATGNTPITWSVETGSLPPGLSLSASTGIISGTPTQTGDFNFTIKVTNNVGADLQDFVIQINTGDGSETYPYIISTAEELAWLATVVNENNTTFNNKYYKLENDIDLSDYQSGEGWIPIGKYGSYYDSPSFRGNFDGNGHKITGLKINSTTLNYIGLFGLIEYGTLKNLGIENAEIEHNNNVSNAAGILVGYIGNNSTVLNCYTTGTVTSNSTSSSNTNAGGLIGHFAGNSVSNCYSTATVTVNSNYSAYAGGIIGYKSSGTLSNCYSTGMVSANYNSTSQYERAYAGGITGYNSEALSNCAALNPNINCTGNILRFGRVTGYFYGTLTSNIAFVDMINPAGNTTWNNTGISNLDGMSTSKAQINVDGTLGGRFTVENGWTVQDRKLPGLFGETVNMPAYLQSTPGAPEITTGTLPVAEINVEYNFTLTANGNTPISWSIIETENYSLPDGLSLSQSGVISGIPTTTGVNNFIIKAQNSLGFDFKEFSINVISDEPVITTETLPDGEVGVYYNQTLTATGNTPITWSIIDGTIPKGLDLNQNTGIISGIPTTEGTFTFTVKAENLSGSDTKTLSIKIKLFGIDDISQQILTAWFQNSTLHISGLIAGEKWSIYNVLGILIYEETTFFSTANRELKIMNGFYIVRQGNRVVKVIKK